jgi:peroxiredoxin/uncharacterized membrane protein YphA (DoxX/SURF4 family)
MDAALLIARLVLAAVFVTAGIAKAADRQGTVAAVTAFGVPAALAMPVAILLPIAELAVAVALVVTGWAPWGAIGALALLAAFSAGIAFNLVRGRRPECHCFGQLSAGEIGPELLVRNAMLAGVGVFVLAAGWDSAGTSAVSWLGDLSGTQVALLVVAAVAALLFAAGGWLLMHLIAQNGRLLLRLEEFETGALPGMPAGTVAAAAKKTKGLAVAAAAPAFELADLEGERRTLDAFTSAAPTTIAVFTSPGCGPCSALFPDIQRWGSQLAGTVAIAHLCAGTAEQVAAKMEKSGIRDVLVDEGRYAARAYGVTMTPSAVAIAADGTIAAPLAEGPRAVRDLVERFSAAPAPAPVSANGASADQHAHNGHEHNHDHGHEHGAKGLPIGSAAPAFELPDLDGRPMSLEELRGEPALVLFWGTSCGFCTRMLPDLKAWEASRKNGSPRLLVVSNGTVETNRAQGVASPVLIDPKFEVGSAFGATGTPSAVLVDAEGKIASNVVVGADAVLDLANGRRPAAQGARPAALAIGQEAPAFRLPDLDGLHVDFEDWRTGETVVLFWSPGCGFCQKMLPELREWEAAAPKGSPSLLIVSNGSVPDNRALGFNSPVLLDAGGEVRRKFRASGTPNAVLVDSRGRVASPVVRGAAAFWDLVGAKR